MAQSLARHSFVRTSGNSLVVTLPIAVVRDMGLNDGDGFFWSTDGNELRGVVVKLANVVQLQPTAAVSEVTSAPAAPTTAAPARELYAKLYAKGPIALDAVIKMLIPNNPKSGKSHGRFARYSDGITAVEYVQRNVEAGVPRHTALADLRWDIKHSFIALGQATGHHAA